MLFYLKGKVIKKKENSVIVELNSFGFQVFLSNKNLKTINLGQDLQVYTDLFIKHNEKIELYGFLTEKELELFRFLIKIPGIGTKAALTLSSAGSLKELQKKITQGDKDLLNGLKGVGKKKLQRILIELGTKISKIETKKEIKPEDKEVIDSLTALGFSKEDISKALEEVPDNIQGREERTKAVLKILGAKAK